MVGEGKKYFISFNPLTEVQHRLIALGGREKSSRN